MFKQSFAGALKVLPLVAAGVFVSAAAFDLSAQTADRATPRTLLVAELAPPDAKTAEPFANIFGVRPLAGNRLLVNDGVRRQLVSLDANLGGRIVVLDSASEGGNSYGRRATPLIPYLGDSTLFVDVASASMLILDPTAKIARVMSAPKATDLGFMANAASGTDRRGNLVYRVPIPMQRPVTQPSGAQVAPRPVDSAAIMRANFETRTVDTVGKIKITALPINVVLPNANGTFRRERVINPLSSVDEWSVLSDGTVAFVRGGDYHVDYLGEDGKRWSSPKLPFDWKRVTDEDKRALLDSARRELIKQDSISRASASANSQGGLAGSVGGVAITRASPSGGIALRSPVSANEPLTIVDAPLSEIADYYPSIRTGAARPDLDGNLWILPTTSAQSQAGELVYDMVNNKGELFQRVRVPVGRSIAGFGKGGVVYLMYRDAEKGWFLERTRVITSQKK